MPQRRIRDEDTWAEAGELPVEGRVLRIAQAVSPSSLVPSDPAADDSAAHAALPSASARPPPRGAEPRAA